MSTGLNVICRLASSRTSDRAEKREQRKDTRFLINIRRAVDRNQREGRRQKSERGPETEIRERAVDSNQREGRRQKRNQREGRRHKSDRGPETEIRERAVDINQRKGWRHKSERRS